MKNLIRANVVYYSKIIDDVCRIVIFPITHTTFNGNHFLHIIDRNMHWKNNAQFEWWWQIIKNDTLIYK